MFEFCANNASYVLIGPNKDCFACQEWKDTVETSIYSIKILCVGEQWVCQCLFCLIHDLVGTNQALCCHQERNSSVIDNTFGNE